MISFKMRALSHRTKCIESYIFCEIAKGTVPASIVFTEEHMLAILSPEQTNPYKMLIIPREHVTNLYDFTDDRRPNNGTHCEHHS